MTFKKSNPFPSDTVVKDSIDELPDYRETESYRRAVAMVEDFSEEFPLASSAGLAMGIRGRFGSGKTHLIFQLMGELAAAQGTHCKPIYAKTDKVDFLDLYVNSFARKFEADDLKKVVSLHLAKLFKLKSSSGTDESSSQYQIVASGDVEPPQMEDRRTIVQIARDEVDQLVVKDPQAVLTLVEKDLLPVSGLSRDFDWEIETTERKEQLDSDGQNPTGLTGGPSNVSLDFFRAYSKLTDPNLSSLAVRWIQGSELSNSERVDLGLESARIAQPGVAKEAMRFLLAAFKKADFAVVFCLDEFERFSSRGTPADVNTCAGLLKDLAEIFRKTGHLLIVAGIDDAWNAMPTDVFARIQTPNIVEMSLSKDEAKGLLDVFCIASGSSFESLFDENAFRLLYEASNYNTRRILDLSYKAYELAADPAASRTRIQEEHVERAANQILSNTKRLEAVGEAIQKVTIDLRLPVQTNRRLEEFTCDYVLGDPQSPQTIIKVTQSIFKLGELSAARDIANLSQLIRREFPQTAFCVVIVGYSTKEVRDELARVVDRVFSFDEDKFATEFQEFLKSAPLRSSQVDDRLKNQEANYQELLQKFDELELARRSEIDQLKEALAGLRAESLRVRETAREKRVTDKMEETLEELDELLDKEEELAFPSLQQGTSVSAQDRFDRARRLLEEQYNHIRRAEILNERLPRAQEFLRKLEKLESLTNQSFEEWYRAFSQISDPQLSVGSEARRLFDFRKRLLSDLQSIHFSRKRAEGIGGFIQEIRHNKLVVALSLLAMLGMVLILSSLYSGWNNEKAAITYYTTQLSTIQGKLLILRIDRPSDISIDSLITDTVTLEAAPYRQTFVGAGLVSIQIPELRQELLALNNLFPPIRSLDEEQEEKVFNSQKQRITSLCAQLQTSLATVSFGSFARKFFSYYSAFTIFCLLPVLMLFALFPLRRFWNWRFARRSRLPT